MTKHIDNALGLNPLPMLVDEEDNLPAPILSDEEQKSEDIDTARENISNAIDVTQTALQDLLSIAQQSQHPKAYEALNAMIKTYADISMGLVDLQMKKQRLNGGAKSSEESKTINNNLFVGSTAELQQMLENMKNKDK